MLIKWQFLPRIVTRLSSHLRFVKILFSSFALFYSPIEAISAVDMRFLDFWAYLYSPLRSCRQQLRSTEDIERHLAAHRIPGVFHYRCKPGPFGAIIQMT
jgi:hypothetical protein